MPVIDRKKSFLYALILLLLLAPSFLLLPAGLSELAGAIGFELMDKTGLEITMSPVNPSVKELSADPSNRLVLKIVVSDSQGNAVRGARITANASEGLGTLAPAAAKTGADGSVLLQYSPPFPAGDAFKSGNPAVKITARIAGTDMKSDFSFTLVRIPVIFIHGYRASPDIFSNMKDYLDGKGFATEGFSYDSEKGVASGTAELIAFIDKVKAGFLDRGIQVGRLDVIAHSMGGLVARYYTCSGSYPARSDINKIIFISVPQMGSPIAPLGLQYYNDKGINDLIPDSALFSRVFPSFINRGLNGSIQVGSILGQFDEVVSPESASLERWGIKTELFDVGDSNFTVDKLLSGKIVEAANHKVVLYNKKVFQRVEEMLDSMLPYPTRL
jgi:pimeloyl-ACP methyl ester carboxylesterase